MINWYIACSGFHYKHWKGSFYPEGLPQTKWFDHYCQFFNAIELNVTFYRFPKVTTLQNWYQKSPENFRFAVKAPRSITHFKKFIGTVDLISDFYTIVREGLQVKLGCILFQLPPNFHYSTDHLTRIIHSLDSSFQNVVEFRHESWWRRDVYQALADSNISFCGMSHPTLPGEAIKTNSLLYYRMHGEGQLYSSNYTAQELEAHLKEFTSDSGITDAYIFFNNDIHTYAIYNALEMKKMI